GWRAILAGGAVGVVALTENGQVVQLPRPRHRGMAAVAGCLERAHDQALAACRTAPHSAAPALLAPAPIETALQVPRGAGILLASGLDLPGDGFEAALAALRARVPLQLFLIEDALETAPPGIAMPCTGGEGRSGHMRFDALPAARDERAARLQLPGQ